MIRRSPLITAYCILLFSAGWLKGGEARDFVFVTSKDQDSYLYTSDGSTTWTQLNSNHLEDYPRGLITDSLYEPSLRRLFIISSLLEMYSLNITGKPDSYSKVQGIGPERVLGLFYDSDKRRVVTDYLERHYDADTGKRAISKHGFLYLEKDGTWHELGTDTPVNFVHRNIKPEYLPGGKGLQKSIDLLGRYPSLRADVKDYRDDENWRLVGVSDHLCLYALQRAASLKKGEAHENLHYLILDERTNNQKVIVIPHTGSGHVFRSLIVIQELTRRKGYPSQGKKDQTGDWYLYFSGAKQIHKRKLPVEFRLQTADEEKDLLYFTAEKVLYELPVTLDGWGEPRKLAVLPIEPDWTFVMPSTP